MPRRRSKRIASVVASEGSRRVVPKTKRGPSYARGQAKFIVPQWFLNNCVKSAGELRNQETTVTVIDSPIVAFDITQCAVSEQQLVPDKYDIPEVLYRSLRNVVSSTPPTDSWGWKSPTNDETMYFMNDFLRLNFPVSRRRSHNFFTAVVEHFAKDIGADLVRLSLDDVERLAFHYTHVGEKSQEQCSSHPDCLDQFFLRHSRSETKGKKESFPFDAIFKSPAAKSKLSVVADTEHVHDSSTPLIIHVHEVFEFTKTPLTRRISECIRDTIRKLDHSDGRVLVIGTDREGSCIHFDWRRTVMQEGDDDDDRYCHECPRHIFLLQFGQNPVPLANLMMPTSSEGQRLLLKRDEKSYIEGKNISNLQKLIRQRPSIDQASAGLLPYAEWVFLNSVVTEILGKGLFNEQRLDMISQAISDRFDINHIEYAILRTEELPKALQTWTDQYSAGRWAKAPVHIQEAITTIQADKDKYKREITLLDSVVDPDDLTDTWDDIELEPDVKTTAMQMVDLNLFNPKSAYGLLKNNRIDGLLLYGPPGTGKTQLARVMAWESKAAMIHVSPADITTKWVGETEKFIKALFNLAKMLFPCIIFIDESDSLFRARSEGDRSWERAQTNQLLLEVDGLRKENTRPFVMLATNHPQYLDPAVLRRVPCRLYVGFPMRQAREKIFNIYLQEEERHSDVDIDMLAGKTRRYTGSDLRYVCIRAAQLCEVELRASDAPDPKRILKMIHFEKALQDIAPSVSEEAMGDLRAFARKFDTHALSRIRLEPAEAQPRQMNTLTARETTKRNAQVSISIDEQHTAKRRMVSTRTPSQMVEEMMKELPYSTPFY